MKIKTKIWCEDEILGFNFLGYWSAFVNLHNWKNCGFISSPTLIETSPYLITFVWISYMKIWVEKKFEEMKNQFRKEFEELKYQNTQMLTKAETLIDVMKTKIKE